MGRIPCCEKDNVKRGQWTPEEDNKLSSYIAQHGTRNWRLIPMNAGLQRCGKSCRLRWTNYLRPDLKHGQFSEAEERTIVKLHSVVGNRWSTIASQLPGRTDNDVKNHWNTKLKKKLSRMGIDPVTHKPFSHLMAEIATTLAPPQVANLTEAALGCFKDEMLHLLTKKHIDFQLHPSGPTTHITKADNPYQKDGTLESSIIQETNTMVPLSNKKWESNGGGCSGFHFDYGSCSSFGNEVEDEGSPWNQSSMCSRSTCTAGEPQGQLHMNGKLRDENGEESVGGKETNCRDGSSSSIFGSDCMLWDLPSDDLMNPLV